MKRLLLHICLLHSLSGLTQQVPEPDKDIPWQDNPHFWEEIYQHPDYRPYYQGENAEEMSRKAWEYPRENGLSEENMPQFLEDLAEDISQDLWESFGEEVLEQLMEEMGIARYLDQAYEQILKEGLPKSTGIPVLDVGMQPAINKGNTPHNLKTMLKLAVENWLNQQWKKEADSIYGIQREDLEYRKKAGLIALLKMARLEREHFLSLEIMLPEQVLSYASQLRQIYQSAEESLAKGNRLYAEFNISATGLELPRQMEKLQLLQERCQQAKITSWELINGRRKTLALAYLQMAERAMQKGKDLQEAIKSSDHLKMTDGDRLKAQQHVNAYMEDYFRYKEKAGLLLSASLENAGTKEKMAQLAHYQQALRLKNLAP